MDSWIVSNNVKIIRNTHTSCSLFRKVLPNRRGGAWCLVTCRKPPGPLRCAGYTNTGWRGPESLQGHLLCRRITSRAPWKQAAYLFSKRKKREFRSFLVTVLVLTSLTEVNELHFIQILWAEILQFSVEKESCRRPPSVWEPFVYLDTDQVFSVLSVSTPLTQRGVYSHPGDIGQGCRHFSVVTPGEETLLTSL